jgi:hypothetical protein
VSDVRVVMTLRAALATEVGLVQPRDSAVRLRGHPGRAARRADALEAAGAVRLGRL